MAAENIFMLYAFGMGMFITFVYDLLRIFRRVIRHNGFWVSLEDLLFWGFCAVEVFLLMHRMNNGTLRWFAVLGALAGMLIYLMTVSRILVPYLSLLLRKLLAVVGRILAFVFRPAAAAGRAVKKESHRMLGLCRRFFHFLKKRLTIMKKVLTMILCKK